MIIQPGTDIGRYHILEQIGEGGMARVYKALDTNLNVEVAVKFIRVDDLPAGQIERTIARFRVEAKKMAQLSHPNIVPVSDFGEYKHTPYLVMPLLRGGSIKKYIGAQMEWRTAAKLIAPVAEALAYTHKKGIIHRDVKPANILLTESDDPMLTDFGIAKIVDAAEARQMTLTGSIIGTPEYMAPEQYTRTKFDKRVDIYALGIVLYELITGRKPFIADTPSAVMIKQSRDPLPRPKNFVPDLPDEVERLLIKALAKEPKDRYKDMHVMAIELRRLANMRTEEEQRMAEKERARQEQISRERTENEKRRKEEETSKATQLAVEQREQKEKELVKKRTIEKEKIVSKKSIASEKLSGKKSILNKKNPSKTIVRIGFAIVVAFFILVQIARNFLPSKSIDTVPEETKIIVTDTFTPISEYAHTEMEIEDEKSRLEINNDCQIAFESDRVGDPGIYVMNADGSSLMRLTSRDSYNDYEPTWSPDGNQIAFVSDRDGDNEIYIMNADGSNQIQVTINDSHDFSPVWSSDGKQIAFTDEDYKFYVIDIDGSNLVELDSNEYENGWYSMYVSPDGMYKAYIHNGGGNYEVFLIDKTKYGETQLTLNFYSDENPAWSPDSNYIIFSSDRDGDYELFVMGKDGTNQTQLTFNTFHDDNPSMSPLCSITNKTSDLTATVDENNNDLQADGNNKKEAPEIIRTMVSEKDNMRMVYVPEGEFEMGLDQLWSWVDDDESPVHTVYLDAFWIDQAEVTNVQYQQCVDDRSCDLPTDTKYYSDKAYSNHPVVYVNWYDAVDYCGWVDRRLPTEAEWEKTGRGTDGRYFPWGKEWDDDCSKANGGWRCDIFPSTSPVGYFGNAGASPYGAYDMTGNVWEWVQDRYSKDYYKISPLTNPTGPNSGSSRVLRGGSWDRYGRLSTRGKGNPDLTHSQFGFRCALSP